MHSTVTKLFLPRLLVVSHLIITIKYIEIMKASISKTATESKTGQYFSTFRNSKRSQWAQYRNFNR